MSDDFIPAAPSNEYSDLESSRGLPNGLLLAIRDAGERSGSNAVSPKGAKGRFQFMDATAKRFGLADPTNDTESARAAADYMQWAKDTYKTNDPRVLAAEYNGGPRAAKAVLAGQLAPVQETRDYINRVNGAMPKQETQQDGEDFIPAKATEAGDDFIPSTPDTPNPVMAALNSKQPLFPGDVTPDVYNWLKEKGTAIGEDPLAALKGAGVGLGQGIMYGLEGLRYGLTRGQPEFAKESAQNILGQANQLSQGMANAMVSPETQQNPGYQAAQEILGAPFIPVQKGAEALAEGGYPEAAAGLTLGAAGAAMALGLRGKAKNAREATNPFGEGEADLGPGNTTPSGPGGPGVYEGEFRREPEPVPESRQLTHNPEAATQEIDYSKIDLPAEQRADITGGWELDEHTGVPVKREESTISAFTPEQEAKWDAQEAAMAKQEGTIGFGPGKKQAGAINVISGRANKTLAVNSDALGWKDTGTLHETYPNFFQALRYVQQKYPRITSQQPMYLYSSSQLKAFLKKVEADGLTAALEAMPKANLYFWNKFELLDYMDKLNREGEDPPAAFHMKNGVFVDMSWIARNVEALPFKNGMREAVGLIMHEYTHELQRQRGDLKDYNLKQDWAKRRQEQEAEKNSALAQRRLPQNNFGISSYMHAPEDFEIKMATGATMPNPSIGGIPVRGRRLNKGTFGQSGAIDLGNIIKSLRERSKKAIMTERSLEPSDPKNPGAWTKMIEKKVNRIQDFNKAIEETKRYRDTLDDIKDKLEHIPDILRGEDGRPLVVYRGQHQFHGTEAMFSRRKTQNGAYAVFTSDSPWAAGGFGRSHIVPMTLHGVKEVIEFPVHEDKFPHWDKLAFDDQARNLGDGQVLVARNVVDTGPNNGFDYPANRETYTMDHYAFTDSSLARPLYETLGEAQHRLGYLSKAGTPGQLSIASKQRGGPKQIKGPTNIPPINSTNYPKSREVLARNDIPVEEFMRQYPEESIKTDIKERAGWATGSFRTNTELKKHINDPTHAIHILAYVDDKMNVAQDHYEKYVADVLHPPLMAWINHYHARRISTFTLAGVRKFRHDVAIAIDFENRGHLKLTEPGGWFNGADYSPTEQQLIDAGMSPESAKVWHGIYEATNSVWPALVNAAKIRHMHVGDRVPGWLPHFWEGPWRVKVKGKEGYIKTISSNTKKQRDKVEKILREQFRGQPVEFELVTPEIGKDIGNLIDALFEHKDSFTKNEGLKALMNIAYERASIGIVQSALERRKNPVLGHQIDRIISGDEFQLTARQTRDAMFRLKRVLEIIPQWNMRATFLTKVLFPLDDAGYFFERGALRRATSQYLKQFLHIPDSAADYVDNLIISKSINLGWNPRQVLNVIKGSQGWLAKYKLFFKPVFWFAQGMQQFFKYAAIDDAKAIGKALGEPTGSITKAMAEDAMYMSRFIKLQSGESLYDYVNKTGHSNAFYTEQMDKVRTLRDPIATGLERQGRQNAARYAFLYYRQFMTEQDALNAAMKLTDRVNVPYGRELGKPFAFMKEGEVVQPITLFLQWNMHAIQDMKNKIDSLRAAGLKPQSTFWALSGVMKTIATMVSMAGVMGIFFSTTYNKLVDWINERFGTGFPTAREWARDLADGLRKSHVLNDELTNFLAKSFEFGIPSALLGYDVSPSMTGPSISSPGEAYFGIVGGILQLAVLGMMWLFSPAGLSKKDIGQWLPEAPAFIQGQLEYYARGNTFQDVLQMMQGKKEDIAPMKKDINLPGPPFTRTPLDTVLNFFGGIKSLEEASFNNSVQIAARHQNIIDALVQKIDQRFKEDPNFMATDEGKKLIYLLADETAQSPKDIMNAVKQYQMEKNMNEDQRKAMGMKGFAGLGKGLRWKDIRESEAKYR